VVVAADRYLAKDTLELVAVDYEPLPAVLDPRGGARPGDACAPSRPGRQTGASFAISTGDVDAALAAARFRLRQRFSLLQTSKSAWG
jgi:aerobic carbon-monoxide dehydrogenase large subunit